MRIEVKVPQLPESVSEATLVNWHKKPGEPIKRDENLIDIETDKVVLELPAPADGVLAEIVAADGATVTSNQVIAIVDTAAARAAPGVAAKAAVPDKPPAKAASAPGTASPAVPAAPTKAAAAADVPPAIAAQALPAARKIIAEQGVAGTDVSGSGRAERNT